MGHWDGPDGCLGPKPFQGPTAENTGASPEGLGRAWVAVHLQGQRRVLMGKGEGPRQAGSPPHYDTQ